MIEHTRRTNRYEDAGIMQHVREHAQPYAEICGSDDFGLNIDPDGQEEDEERGTLRGVGITEGNDIILQYYKDDEPRYYWLTFQGEIKEMND